jgi:hypothetical protein
MPNYRNAGHGPRDGSQPTNPLVPALTPGPTKLLWDSLADAEREVLKLRRLLVVKLCDCRALAVNLPLEPHQHRLTCLYRREMQ